MTEGEAFVTILYALVGASGALSIVLFGWGLALYFSKFGLPAAMRDPGIAVMEWGVRLAITAVFLIVVLKLVEKWVG